VILLLMYCRTGAPWGIASVGIVGPVAVVGVAPVGAAGSGCWEAAREGGCCCCCCGCCGCGCDCMGAGMGFSEGAAGWVCGCGCCAGGCWGGGEVSFAVWSMEVGEALCRELLWRSMDGWKEGARTAAGASVIEMSCASGAGMPLTVSGLLLGFSMPGTSCGACSDMSAMYNGNLTRVLQASS
jgi:hypothetical protein